MGAGHPLTKTWVPLRVGQRSAGDVGRRQGLSGQGQTGPEYGHHGIRRVRTGRKVAGVKNGRRGISGGIRPQDSEWDQGQDEP